MFPPLLKGFTEKKLHERWKTLAATTILMYGRGWLDFTSELSLSSYLNSQDRSIAIENLRVSGRLKNHKLSGAIADLDFYELKWQIE